MNIPEDFKQLDDREWWYQSPTQDHMLLEQRVLKLQEEIPLPVQVICGLINGDTGHRIYLIEDIEPAELVEQFEVGSHSLYSYGTDDCEQCYEEMEALDKIAPYRPYFADAAGFKARFIEPITRQQAIAVEELLTVGLEIYQSEWDGGEYVLVNKLIKENQFHLWWD